MPVRGGVRVVVNQELKKNCWEGTPVGGSGWGGGGVVRSAGRVVGGIGGCE